MMAGQAVAAVASTLAAAGIEDARREARILLAGALGTDAAGLLRQREIDPAVFAPHLARRAAREPMAYVLGRREFWGLKFLATAAALIPRPDSETLIEAALEALPARPAVRRVLDLGTGTGCLLLAALSEFPAAFGVGVDRSAAATALARCNAAALGLGGRAVFLVGDWAAALATRFELILANPPYIAAGALAALSPEVRHEPLTALDGGPDGLAAYRAILPGLPALLAPGGVAVLEFGAGQLQAVQALAVCAGLASDSRADLAGHARALILRRPQAAPK